jgi:hypothetical protein
MSQKLISMTEKELVKYDVIKDLIEGKIDGTDASKQLSLTTRHIRRLKQIVKKYGVEGLAHKNRGKESNKKIDPETLQKVEGLLKEKYYFCKPTFATEKLNEDEDIIVSKETIRNIMVNIGLWKIKPKKKGKVKHLWRPRKDNLGELEQFDGSYHLWLEDRCEELCLLLSIDDATGNITHAKFDLNESTLAVFKFWLEYFAQNGLPVAIYLDKYSTYKINHKNAVDNKDMITQFERAMNQIGVRPITAHSPQAKGRVERVFETLQDRLVKEMRLKNISSIEEANEFLKEYIPKFNAKFGVVPTRRKDLHKKVSKQLQEQLLQIFSIQNTRVVMNDYTIMFKTKYFQLDREQPTTVYKKDLVIVEEHLDDTIKINLKGHYLSYKVLPERPRKQIDIKLPALTKKEQSDYKPPLDHPWRKQFIFGDKLKVEQPNLIKEKVLG